MQNAFARLRDHAAERGIEFTISFEEFERFATETNYVTRTGNERESLTVDRKDNLKGYIPGNIRALTRAENTAKRNKHDEIRFKKGYAWANGNADDDIPSEQIPF